jgi:hypothetical protein
MAGAGATAQPATAATTEATTLAVVNKSMPAITGVFETGQQRCLAGVGGRGREGSGPLREGCWVCVDAAGSCQPENTLFHTQEHA